MFDIYDGPMKRCEYCGGRFTPKPHEGKRNYERRKFCMKPGCKGHSANNTAGESRRGGRPKPQPKQETQQ